MALRGRRGNVGHTGLKASDWLALLGPRSPPLGRRLGHGRARIRAPKVRLKGPPSAAAGPSAPHPLTGGHSLAFGQRDAWCFAPGFTPALFKHGCRWLRHLPAASTFYRASRGNPGAFGTWARQVLRTWLRQALWRLRRQGAYSRF